MRANIPFFISMAIIFLVGGVFVWLSINKNIANEKLNNLIAKEKYLKIVLTNNKYSGYLAIKSHYEKKLMAYAIKHKGDKFALALAKKEEAEVKYYEGAK
jgi:hypothetical protein